MEGVNAQEIKAACPRAHPDSHKIAEMMYSPAPPAAGTRRRRRRRAAGRWRLKEDDDVVDAGFEEVKK